jgi:hypothetical protein
VSPTVRRSLAAWDWPRGRRGRRGWLTVAIIGIIGAAASTQSDLGRVSTTPTVAARAPRRRPLHSTCWELVSRSTGSTEPSGRRTGSTCNVTPAVDGRAAWGTVPGLLPLRFPQTASLPHGFQPRASVRRSGVFLPRSRQPHRFGLTHHEAMRIRQQFCAQEHRPGRMLRKLRPPHRYLRDWSGRYLS